MAYNERKKEYNKTYQKEKTTQRVLQLNYNTDIDIIDWLEKNRPFATYVKKLIRKDMEERK